MATGEEHAVTDGQGDVMLRAAGPGCALGAVTQAGVLRKSSGWGWMWPGMRRFGRYAVVLL